jgi:hypothetical protein
MLTHIVFFKLVDPSTAPAVRDAILALREPIPQLRHLEAGVDVVHTDRSWDLALFARFDDRAGLDAYSVHPAHVAFVEWLRPYRQAVCAVDYESP